MIFRCTYYMIISHGGIEVTIKIYIYTMPKTFTTIYNPDIYEYTYIFYACLHTMHLIYYFANTFSSKYSETRESSVCGFGWGVGQEFS